jgi:predicted DNA binding protein
MREFVFTIRYESNSDPLMDVFIDHPHTIATSLACSVTTESMWRLDRVSGPPPALDAIEEVLFDRDRCEECIGSRNCHGASDYEIVAATERSRTIYVYRPEIEECHSIPYLAAAQLGDGLLFETIRHEHQYRWRILLREDAAVGELYDTLQTDLREGIELDLQHLSTPTHWGDAVVTVADLPSDQRAALEAAVEHGYYEQPRAATAAEIAEELELPQSTFQYRLQRAEAWLASRFVTETV